MFKKIIPRSETSKNILTLITGTTIAQAIPLALSPILTRLYSPEEFGTFALYLSIVAIFGVISTGRYELAIMLPKKNEDAKNILILSISIALVISLLLLLLVFLFNAQIVSLFNNKAISKWLYFIPVSVLLTGVYNTLKSWFNREKKYKIIASNGIIRTSTVGVSNLGFGYGGFNSSGLIIGNVLGLLISVITFTKKIFMSNRYFLHKISRVKINKMARRYIDFPKINLLHSFLDMGRESGIIFILSYFLSTELVGIYFFSANIIKMPLTVISSSISQIFFKKISENYNKKIPIDNTIKSIILKLALTLPIFVLIYIFSPLIFSSIFGLNWLKGGYIIQALIPWLGMSFISASISTVPMVLEKQKEFFKIGFFYNLIIVVFLFLFLYIKIELITSLTILSYILFLYLMFTIIWIYKLAKKDNSHGI